MKCSRNCGREAVAAGVCCPRCPEHGKLCDQTQRVGLDHALNHVAAATAARHDPQPLSEAEEAATCPFCSSAASLNPFIEDKSGNGLHDYAYVACKSFDDCGVVGPRGDSDEEALAKWNRAATRIANLRAAVSAAKNVTRIHAAYDVRSHALRTGMDDLRAALAKVEEGKS